MLDSFGRGRENPRVTFDAVVAAVANAEADALQAPSSLRLALKLTDKDGEPLDRPQVGPRRGTRVDYVAQ